MTLLHDLSDSTPSPPSSVFQGFSTCTATSYNRLSSFCLWLEERMRKAGLISLILFSLAVLAFAQDEPKDEPKHAPSTAAERQRFLALTRKLEQSPLDKSLYAEKTWAKKWLEDIPDINVNIC